MPPPRSARVPRFANGVAAAIGLPALLLSILTFPAGPAAAQAGEDHVTTSVLVELHPGVPAEEVTDRHRPVLERWIEVPVGPGETAEQAVERLSRVPGVASVRLDRYLHAFGATSLAAFPQDDPDDPLYPLQWNLPAAGVPDAWPSGGGAGVVVAVVDSGVTKAGEDLTRRDFVHEYDAVEDVSGPGSAEDGDGHGTPVAGTIAQCTDNRVAVAGIAQPHTGQWPQPPPE